MSTLQLSVEEVKVLIPTATDVEELDRGGQKIVFVGEIDGQKYALKFLEPDLDQLIGIEDTSAESQSDKEQRLDQVTARAQREVETMSQCSTPRLVGMGPIGLKSAQIDGKSVIYFTEEYIEGENLKTYLSNSGPFPLDELVRLAYQISEAIAALWALSKVHRDIKPQNIMRESGTGDFVLLDLGLVLDLQDVSLSLSPVGTLIYFSPEQWDFQNRRTVINFRSDLFCLGIVLYEMATGVHPFIARATNSMEVFANITNHQPEPPISLRAEIGKDISDIIMRLLAKRPALRYRSIELFHRALGEIKVDGSDG